MLVESADGSVRPLAGVEVEFLGKLAESAFSDKDGAFDIKGLGNGHYDFSGGLEMPKGHYVASVREKDIIILSSETNLSSSG